MKWLVPLGLMALAVWGGEEMKRWTFEKDEVGKPPQGFEFSTTRQTPAGRWQVVEDEGKKVLAQLDQDETDVRFAMAVVKDSSYKDLKLSVRGKPVKGEQDQTVGLVWRYKDADNYYLARLNALEANVRLYRVVNGNRIKFAGKEGVELKAGQWYTLAVEHLGTHIVVTLDGKTMCEGDDKTFPDAGKLGLWIKSDSVSYFTDLGVEEMK